MIEFTISRASEVPAHRQLVEQAKVALLTGTLRAGEMLPSIRDLEKGLGITAVAIRRAYAELARQGIVTAWHGKGVQINERLTYHGAQALVERYNAIVDDVLTRVEKEGLVLSSFARLVMARAQEIERVTPPLVYIDATADVARERAVVISRAWSIHVDGRSLAELRPLLKGDRPPGKILTNYYRHSQVLALAGPKRIPVIPIGLSYSRTMVERIEQLPPRARLLLVFDAADRARAGLMLDDYRRRLNRSDVRFEGRAFSGVRGLRRLAMGRAYALLVVSVRVWDRIPDALKALPRVMRTEMEFAPARLEEARIAAEVIL